MQRREQSRQSREMASQGMHLTEAWQPPYRSEVQGISRSMLQAICILQNWKHPAFEGWTPRPELLQPMPVSIKAPDTQAMVDPRPLRKSLLPLASRWIALEISIFLIPQTTWFAR